MDYIITRPSKWCINKIEKERGIRLPSYILNQKGIMELDKVIATKNPLLIHVFLKNDFEKYFGLPSFYKITKLLTEKRELIEEDKNIISELVKIKNKDPYLFLDSIGNIFYIANLSDEIGEATNLSDTIKISLKLYLFVNLVEITSKYISRLLLEHLKNNGNDKEFRRFKRYFDDGGHPTLEKMISVMETVGFLKDRKESIFSKNKLIRNRISHANMYYDADQNKIYLTNGQEYSIDQLDICFKSLSDFLNELLFQFNGCDTDILKSVKVVVEEIAKLLLIIERSGDLRNAFIRAPFWKELS